MFKYIDRLNEWLVVDASNWQFAAVVFGSPLVFVVLVATLCILHG